MPTEVETSSSEVAVGNAELRRRGRRLLLAERAFSSIIGATHRGVFLTALIVVLGGQEGKIGLGAAALHIGAVGMLIANPILNHIGSRRVFCLLWLGVVRVLRVLIVALVLMVYLGLDRDLLYWPMMGLVMITAFFGMSGEISRRSWISDLVSPEYRGRFFAKRIKIALLANVGVLMIGGMLLDWSKSEAFPLGGDGQALMLSILLGAGGVAGWIGWLLLYRAPEPPMIQPRRSTGLLRSLSLPWRRPRYRPLIILATSYYFAVGLCATFFVYYMLDHLKMSWMWIAVVETAAALLGVAGASYFGAWADRVGARRVLTVAMLVKGLFPLFWLFATPQTWPIVFVLVLVRTFDSAMQICWLRLSLNLAPTKNQMAYLAMHQAMVGIGLAMGALVGGGVAEYLKQFDMVVLGLTVVPLHVLFILSTMARLMCLSMVRFIREPQHILATGSN